MLREKVGELLAKNMRLDGREPLQYRKDIKVTKGHIASAAGSAMVEIGETKLIAGVKLEIGKPYPDSPDQGSIMVGAELYPLSSPEFEPGPPSIQAVELARVVDRGIRESHAVDFKKLCIEEGEKAWVVIIDICTINDAGNLFDAAALAAVAALQDTKFPELDDEGNIKEKSEGPQMTLDKTPVSVTVYRIDDGFIVDPISDEEKAYDARLTVAFEENGTLVAMQKGGEGTLTPEDVMKMVDIAGEKANELRAFLA